MGHRFAELAFTDNVRALQAADGSRNSYLRMEEGPDVNDRLGERETDFIVARDSFYMATAGETGWPYVQHRGGPPGFLSVLDDRTLAFPDFRGNRQFISAGNLRHDDRVSLILMDYPNRQRLKLLGRAGVSDDPAVLEKLALPDYRARIERAFVIRLEAFDWNCPQHIAPRYTDTELEALAAPLRERIAVLEAQLAAPRENRS